MILRFDLYRNGQKTGEGVRWSDGLIFFRIQGEGSKPREAGLSGGRLPAVLWGLAGEAHTVRWIDG